MQPAKHETEDKVKAGFIYSIVCGACNMKVLWTLKNG